MSLPSSQLDAFVAVARHLSFSNAAKSLGLTQSALSQRISNLEDELAVTLFVRDRSGVRLTDEGSKLLRHCQSREDLERELLENLGAKKDRGGIVRMAGYSSVARSVLLPALAPLFRDNLSLQLQLFSRETHELPGLLQRGEADYIVLDHKLERTGIEAVLLGYEQLIAVESNQYKSRDAVFLDHDPNDETTERFLRQHMKSLTTTPRSYLDDVYGILDGVALGFGRAVISKHLLRSASGVRLVKGFKPTRTPVYLHHYAKPFYSKLHEQVVGVLTKNSSDFLR